MTQGVVRSRSRAFGHRSAPRPRPWSGTRPAARHAVHSQGGLRFVTVTLLALIPGAGLLALGRRLVGGFLLLVALAAAGLGVFAVLAGEARAKGLALAVRPNALLLAAGIAALVGLVWAVSVAVTGWLARPRHTRRSQRVLGTTFVALLTLAVAAPSAFAARYALIQRDVVQSVFGGSASGQPASSGTVATPGQAADPWKDTPRVNVLLLGSDAGADRTGV